MSDVKMFEATTEELMALALLYMVRLDGAEECASEEVDAAKLRLAELRRFLGQDVLGREFSELCEETELKDQEGQMANEEKRRIDMDYVPECRWVHTHGLEDDGLPDLDMRNVLPEFRNAAAAILLEAANQISVMSSIPADGDLLVMSDGVTLRCEKAKVIAGAENHFLRERLTLVGVTPHCEMCGCECECC